MPIEDNVMNFVGLPAIFGVVFAIIGARLINDRPYVVILFAILGLLIGYGAAYSNTIISVIYSLETKG